MLVSLFNAVPVGAIETVSDSDNKPHFMRADLGRYLGIADIRHNFKDIATKSRSELSSSGGGGTPSRSGTRGGGKNPQDAFVDLDTALEIVVRSKKAKAVELVKWLAHKGVEKVIEDHQKDMEEKDTQLALLNDDLAESEDLVRQLEYNNTGLQGEMRAKDEELAVLRQRYVPILEDDRKNYGMTIITKNNESAEYPFISICGQHGYRKQKKKMVLLKNPGSTEFADGDTPNAIVTYNMWREHGLIKTDPRKPRDFRLVNIGEDQLFLLRD